jgi:hypothetical protein
MSPKKKSGKKKNKNKIPQGSGKSSTGQSVDASNQPPAPPPTGNRGQISIGVPVSEEVFNKMKEQAKKIIRPSKN